MIEIFLLAGAISIDLEPHAVENPEPDTYGQGINTDAFGRAFQWETQLGKKRVGSIFQDKVDPDDYGIEVGKDWFGRPVEVKD